MALSAGEISGILQEMKNNGQKYSSTSNPEQKIAAHDANVTWAKYLQENGYSANYNSLTGDWTIEGGSLYGVPSLPSQQPSPAASNSYFPTTPIPVQQPASGNETSLLQADTPNIGGVIAIGAVLGLLFLLK